jgi:hypothetical protein
MQRFRRSLRFHHQGFMWWMLCPHCTRSCTTEYAVGCPCTYRRGKSARSVWYKYNMRIWIYVHISTYCRSVLRINIVDIFCDRILYVKTSSCSVTEPFIHRRLYSPLLDTGLFFSFVILYTVNWTLWTSDQPVARPLPTHRKAQTQNKHTQTLMPRVGFEPTNGRR